MELAILNKLHWDRYTGTLMEFLVIVSMRNWQSLPKTHLCLWNNRTVEHRRAHTHCREEMHTERKMHLKTNTVPPDTHFPRTEKQLYKGFFFFRRHYNGEFLF